MSATAERPLAANSGPPKSGPPNPGPAPGPLPVRVRADLIARRHEYLGRSSWIVKEPLALKYHRFNDEEYALLMLLDGRSTLQELLGRFQQRFPHRRLSPQDLQQFLGSLHRANLVLIDAPGEGQRQELRHDEHRRRKRWSAMGGLLSIRFRGIDPQWLLDALDPITRWFFSPLAVCGCLCLGLAALLLVVVRFEDFAARLPAMHEFFGAANIFYLAIVLTLTKIAHELGHALLCRRFGARCHEMGLLLLVFTPCLYCNVSDAWLLKSKWQRAAIGAAGVYVELMLASLATFLWWFSEPGLLNHLCLNIMFICSVSTLLFNANPLLRYDAYYILGDLVEIPNLRQRSQDYVARLWWQMLGRRQPPDPFTPRRRRLFLVVYGIAAACYRWFVLLSILWFLHVVLRPYRLEILGQMLAVVTIFGLVVSPIFRLIRFLRRPPSPDPSQGSSQVSKIRLAFLAAAVVAVGAAAFLAPLPSRVSSPLQVRPRAAAGVYVELSGTLEEVLVHPGQRVTAGTPLARLSNYDVELGAVELQGRVNKLQAELESLKQRRLRAPAISVQIPQIEESLAVAERQLAQKLRDRERLILRAPRDGVVMRVAAIPPPEKSEHAARTWHGDLFEARNRFCHLRISTLVCQIGDPAELEAVLVVDQSDVELIREGDEVNIQLQAAAGKTLTGKIETIASKHLLAMPRQLSQKAGGTLPSHTDAAGNETPLSTAYAAIVPLHDTTGIAQDGFKGQAQIITAPRSLTWRAGRYLAQTFRFK